MSHLRSLKFKVFSVSQVVLLIFATSLFAQDSLFDDDFVKSPVEKKENWEKRREPLFGGNDKRPGPTPVPSKVSKDSRQILDKKVTAVSSELVRVKSIGVVLNCMDDKHFLTHILQFRETALAHKFPIGSVVCHGRFGLGYKSENKELVTLMMMGADMQTHYELPAPYSKLTYSPTWMVETPDGEIWLEATEKPFQDYFTATGRFIVPNPEANKTKSFFSDSNDVFQ